MNTVKIEGNKWIGYNTDGLGYVKGLKQVYPDLSNAYILILGAGRKQRYCNCTFTMCTPKLTIANRTMSRFDNWKLDINAITLQQVNNILMSLILLLIQHQD